ncbi:MAG: hypothetical protein R3E85_07525 [Planctomycetota bacterium]
MQLNVRPLVGERGQITLDVAPTINLPDAALTAGIRESTGWPRPRPRSVRGP